MSVKAMEDLIRDNKNSTASTGKIGRGQNGVFVLTNIHKDPL